LPARCRARGGAIQMLVVPEKQLSLVAVIDGHRWWWEAPAGDWGTPMADEMYS
jgi:hypothetical protein